MNQNFIKTKTLAKRGSIMKCRVCILFAVAIFAISEIYAVPAYPYPIEVTQPDGTTLTIRLNGDERFNYTSTEDGYMIVKNHEDFYVYATVSQVGTVQPTARIARNANERTAVDAIFLQSLDVDSEIERLRDAANTGKIQKAAAAAQEDLPTIQRYPATGSPKALVILVNFTDKSFVTANPQTAFSNLCNQQGYSANGATGSVKDWYKASSYGKFAPDFDVFGPYTLPNNMAYYGANSGGNDVRPAQMTLDACVLAYNDGVNFANYDADNDGYIDNVFIIYAGHNEAEGGPANTVWPHRWVVSPGYNCTGSNMFNGKRLYDYACTSELRGSSGSTMAGIGTFVHEFAHVINLPDHYHTTSSSKNTLNYWSVMDMGSYCNNGRTPPLLSAYDRFYLGWHTPEQYTIGQKTLYPLSQSGTAAQTGQAYLLAVSNHNLNGKSPNPSEFFVIEYREKTGWDAYLGNNSTSNNSTATSGMLFWHIDYNASAWNNNSVNNYTGTNQTQSSHMRVYLEPTNGLSQTTPGNAFTSGSFIPKLWNGTSLTAITNITKNGTTNMTFGIYSVPPDNDLCANAFDLYCDATIQGTLAGATPTTPVKYSNNSDKNDVFYKFTTQNAGIHSVTLTFNTPYDIGLDLYSSCNTTNILASLTVPGTMFYDCTAGTDYYVRVIDRNGTGGSFNISLDCSVSWQIGYPNAADVTATLYKNTLTFSGTGAMQNFNFAPWYSVKNKIKNVVISNNITSIGNNAFLDCVSLTSVNIPNSVTSIGEFAFKNTSLTSIEIPNSVNTLGNYVFEAAPLKTVNINWATPLLINSTVFFLVNIENVKLYVPAGRQCQYSETPVWQDFNIVKQSQTITFPTVSTKTYGDVPITLSATSTSDLPIIYQSSNPEVAMVDGDTLIITGTGTTIITATQSSDCAYSSATQVTTLTVNKAPLTVIPNNATRKYGDANPELTFNYEGFVNNENASVITSSPIVATVATAKSPAGKYDITCSGGDVANYDFYYQTGTLTVSKALATITANNCSMVYGDTLPAFTCRYEGFLNGDTEKYLNVLPVFYCNVTSAGNAGSYLIIPSSAVSQNYSFNYQIGTLKIEKRPLSVIPNNATREYGDANPEFTFSYEGFVNDENSSVITASPIGATTATKNSTVGNYNITCSGGGATNYSFTTYGTGTLSVTKAPLTIKANDTTRKEGEPNPDFTFSYSGFKNGEDYPVLDKLPVATCIADENFIQGDYDIILSGGNDKNYSYILVNGTLKVTSSVNIGSVLANQLKIYPNPVKDEIIIDNGQWIINNNNIEIYDISGRKMVNCQLSIINYQLTINVSNLPSGIYILKIGDYRGRFVKE